MSEMGSNFCLKFLFPSAYSNTTNSQQQQLFNNLNELNAQHSQTTTTTTTTINADVVFEKYDCGSSNSSSSSSSYPVVPVVKDGLLNHSTFPNTASNNNTNYSCNDNIIDDYHLRKSEKMIPEMQNCQIENKKKKRIISKMCRERRNISERKRREKHDECITNLASLIPLVAESRKKLNKLDVLRLAGSYLRLHKLSSDHRLDNCESNFFKPSEFDQLLLEAFGGFVAIIDTFGKVIYVSNEVKKVLNYDLVDVFGQSIYSFVHPDDEDTFKSSVAEMIDSDCEKIAPSVTPPHVFYCSMKMYSDVTHCAGFLQYELVKVVGSVRTLNKVPPTTHTPTRDEVPGSRSDKIVTLVIKPCVGNPLSEIVSNDKDRRPMFSIKVSLNGRIRLIDSQFTVIFGRFCSEVTGRSIFENLLEEDLPIALMIHRQLLSSNTLYRIPYRIHTYVLDCLYLMLSSRRIIDVNGIEPDYFISECTIVPDHEGETAFMTLKHYLTPYVANKDFFKEPSSLDDKKNLMESSMMLNRVFGSSESKIRRPRGRPRKQPVYKVSSQSTTNSTTAIETEMKCDSGCNNTNVCKHAIIKEVESMADTWSTEITNQGRVFKGLPCYYDGPRPCTKECQNVFF